MKLSGFLKVFGACAVFAVAITWWAWLRNMRFSAAEEAALAALKAAELVDFAPVYDCAPENPALYTEWERRRIDAETAIVRLPDGMRREPELLALDTAAKLVHLRRLRCQNQNIDSLIDRPLNAR